MSHVLVIKNWDRYQHYKNRNAPWVKLYRDMLSSEAWVLGTDLSRLLQVASTALAARYDNNIPYRFDVLKKVLSLDCSEANFKKAIDHLSAYDFLEIQKLTIPSKDVVQDASKALDKCPPKESREEEIRGEENRTDMSPSGTAAIGIQKVFDHWRQVHNHPKAQLDDKRRKLISNALKVYSADDLCLSISGYKNSAHHMGKNDQKTVYDDIEIFLRDAKHVDAGIRFSKAEPGQEWAM